MPRTSSLRCFVAFLFATVLAGCHEIQRIYQNRISVISTGVHIETFEVVGLATVELESEVRPTYFFDCNTTVNNGTGMNWTRQSGELNFRVEDIPFRTNGKRLTAARITANDLGTYICWDTYSNTRVSVNITQDNPAVQPANRVLRVMQGSNATITVYVSGYPLVASEQIHWYRPNGTEIMEKDGVFEDERRSLVITGVQFSDAGVYMCQVNTTYGNHRTTIQLDVYGSSPLRVYQGRIQSDVEVFQVRGLATVEFDNSVTFYLDCNTTRNDGSGITWMKIGGNNPFQVSDVGTGNGRRLSLSGVRDSHLGSYLCYDTLSEDRATINITADNPAMSAVNRLVEVLEGDHALLEVYVSSYPLVTSDHIRWYWPNSSEVTDGGAEFMSDGRALFLVNVKSSDAGVYRCEVNVSATGRTSSAFIQLNVYAQPVIISHPRMVSTATEWKNIAIQCDASGIPPPTITWEREGGIIPSTTATVITSGDTLNRVTSVLMFSGVRYRDRGRYRCVADNSHTPLVKSDYALLRVTPNLLLAVNISGEPQLLQDSIVVVEGSEVTIECTGSGSLQWTLSGGQEIPTGYQAPGNLYQEYIHSGEVQLLHIRNFSSSDVATYRCKTNLTTDRGNAIEIAVTLKGDTVTESAQTTSPEPQSDGAAAIVGGVLSGIILAVLVVLFVLVIMLVVQRRSKGSASVAGVVVDRGVPIDNGVNLTSVVELKPEENIQASDSIEKLNDNNPLGTTTDKMDEIL